MVQFYHLRIILQIEWIRYFDNNGINPDMDLMASTTIVDEEIRLKIKGDLNNADLVLESSSGFSESDIIELLTFGSRFEDQALSSNGFGVQATSMLGSLLETQQKRIRGDVCS